MAVADRLPPILPKALLALGLGTLGGAAANALGLPLAWMIGAMTATGVAALGGAPVAVPKKLRAGMVMILGVMLGSAFNPAIVDQLGPWAISLATMLVYVVVATTAVTVLLMRWKRYDPVTAYFTGTPGGFNEMVLVGGSLGGDDRVIALSHSLRIMLVVFTVPIWFQFIGAYDPGTRPPIGARFADLDPTDALLMLACLAGAPVARLVRIPAAQLVGPMLFSAAVHLAGWTDSYPPAVLVGAAQVVVGSFIGCRFVGTRIGTLLPIAGGAVLLTLVLMILCVLFAGGLHVATGLPFAELVLAFAPGGLKEMSLVALALGADAAFVSTHHIVRIVFVVILAPPAFIFLRRRWQGANGTASAASGDGDTKDPEAKS